MKQRKDGRWVKKVKLHDGTSKYFYSNAKSEREAVKDFNRQILEVQNEAENKNSFKTIAEQWAEETFGRIENNSLKAYRPAQRECIKFFEGKMVQDITPTDVKNFVAMYEKKGYAKKTIKGKLSVLSLIMKYALIEQLIPSNPCQFITIKIPNTREKRQPASDADIKRIKENKDVYFGFFAIFLLYTGLRRGEAFAITPKDIDYKEKTITVSKTVEWIGNKPQIKNHPKTDAGHRTLPLPDLLMDELIKRKKNNYIFQTEEGKLLDNSQITRSWNKYKTETGVSATPHMLRHSYATMLFDANIDVKTAQTWLGHKDIKTTLDIYTHLSNARRSSSILKWQEYVQRISA